VAPHALREEARERMPPMARVKNAVKGEDIPAEKEAASPLSAAVDNQRKTLSV
jgi:hypothetical protein